MILARAEAKDYLDIYTLLKAGITLPRALGAAKALYPEFNPALSLKALAYYGEPNLAAMPVEIREFLTAASAKVELIETIPKLQSTSVRRIATPAVRLRISLRLQLRVNTSFDFVARSAPSRSCSLRCAPPLTVLPSRQRTRSLSVLCGGLFQRPKRNGQDKRFRTVGDRKSCEFRRGVRQNEVSHCPS